MPGNLKNGITSVETLECGSLCPCYQVFCLCSVQRIKCQQYRGCNNWLVNGRSKNVPKELIVKSLKTLIKSNSCIKSTSSQDYSGVPEINSLSPHHGKQNFLRRPAQLQRDADYLPPKPETTDLPPPRPSTLYKRRFQFRRTALGPLTCSKNFAP